MARRLWAPGSGLLVPVIARIRDRRAVIPWQPDLTKSIRFGGAGVKRNELQFRRCHGRQARRRVGRLYEFIDYFGYEETDLHIEAGQSAPVGVVGVGVVGVGVPAAGPVSTSPVSPAKRTMPSRVMRSRTSATCAASDLV